jgi:hypothetical protein
MVQHSKERLIDVVRRKAEYQGCCLQGQSRRPLTCPLILVFPALLLGLCVLFSGCCSTTPTGVFGTFDLRSHLPEGLMARIPTDDKAAAHRAEVETGDPAAKILIRWRSFTDGPHNYLLSTTFEVVRQAWCSNLKAEVGTPVNLGTKEAVIEGVPVLLQWNHDTLIGPKSGAWTGVILSTGDMYTY